jgi:hypothetical protein
MSRWSAVSDYDYAAETDVPEDVYADEDYLEQRQTELVIFCREFQTADLLKGLGEAADVAEGQSDLAVELRAYASEFGWPMTLRAVSAAMQLEERGESLSPFGAAGVTT